MDKQQVYGSLKVAELKKLLKTEGAKVGGRKAELVQRLIFYNKNDDFGYQKIGQDDIIKTPAPEKYKDINSSSPSPAFTEAHFRIFLKKYDKTADKAIVMYKTGFLKHLRFRVEDSLYFLKASCKAEMKKHMQYFVDVSLSMNGEIQGSSCDCPVGHSEEAHCKHVLVTLLAMKDFAAGKKIILEETCTQVLQTFHMPSKRYTGSPVKAEKFRKKSYPSVCEKPSENVKIWYDINYFRNLIVAKGINCNMSMKQLVEPANTYGVDWDHSFYTKGPSNVIRVLESLNLLNVSQESARKIELEAREQGGSTILKFERSIRLSASMFQSCCHKYLDEEGAQSLVNKIMYPVQSDLKAMEHEEIHEQTAINKLQNLFNNILEIEKCGLFIPVDRPYLSASPNRLLFCDSVVVVKCPYTNRFQKINEITVPYLKRDRFNNLSLKVKHPYYYQIQGQLYVTGRQFCDFVVYTFADICVIPIRRNEKFIAEMLKKLDIFYFKYLRPAIIEKYLYKNYGDTFFH